MNDHSFMGGQVLSVVACSETAIPAPLSDRQVELALKNMMRSSSVRVTTD